MADRPDFQEKQYAFAAHIRDPHNVPAPEGIEDRRMAIYRNLFFNNLKSLLATFYPVLRKLHDDDHWNRFIRQFMRAYRAQTPYFLQMPEEFLSFLRDEYKPEDDDYPFLVELAHYEYSDLALRVSDTVNDMDGIDPDGDLLANVPVKSELADMHAYQYPVHRISTDYQPEEPSSEPVFITMYRKSDDKVGYLEMNPITAGLLNAIAENEAGRNGEELLREFAASINFPDVDAFISHGAAALEEMRTLEILTGTRSN